MELSATPTPVPQENLQSSEAYRITRSGRTRDSANSRVVFDGNVETVWSTSGNVVSESAFVWVDLGRELPIGAIRWIVSNATEGVTLTIEVSDDRRDWTPAANDLPLTAGEWQTFESDVVGRYVRFIFANPNGAAVFGYLAEVEIAP